MISIVTYGDIARVTALVCNGLLVFLALTLVITFAVLKPGGRK